MLYKVHGTLKYHSCLQDCAERKFYTCVRAFHLKPLLDIARYHGAEENIALLTECDNVMQAAPCMVTI
jgi:hypothetical protein